MFETNTPHIRRSAIRIFASVMAIACAFMLAAASAGKAFAVGYESPVGVGLYVTSTGTSDGTASGDSHGGVNADGGAFNGSTLGVWVVDSSSPEGANNVLTSGDSAVSGGTTLGIWVTDSSMSPENESTSWVGTDESVSGGTTLGIWVTDSSMSPENESTSWVGEDGVVSGDATLGIWVTDSRVTGEDGEELNTSTNGTIAANLGLYVTNGEALSDVVRIAWDLNNNNATWIDGTNNIKAQNIELVEGDETLIMPAAVTNIPGYYLAGWKVNGGTTISFTDPAAGTLNTDLAPYQSYMLTADWQPRQYQVNLEIGNGGSLTTDWNGGFSGPDGSVTLPGASSVTARDGYEFDGWSPSTNPITVDVMETGDVAATTNPVTTTVTAQWKAQASTIVFESFYESAWIGEFTYNGQPINSDNYTIKGSVEGSTDESLPSTKPPTLNSTPKGYTFGGWYENSDFSGNAVTELVASFPAGGKIYYAKWTKGFSTYDIEFYTVSGEDPVKTETAVRTDETITLPTQGTDEGDVQLVRHKLSGWYAFSGNEVPPMSDNRVQLTDSSAAWQWAASSESGTTVDVSDIADAVQPADDDATLKLYAAWTPIYSVTMPIDSDTRDITLKRGENTAIAGRAITMESQTPRSVELYAKSDPTDDMKSLITQVLCQDEGDQDITSWERLATTDAAFTFAQSIEDGDSTGYSGSEDIPLIDPSAAYKYVGTATSAGTTGTSTLPGTLVLKLSDYVANNCVTLIARDDWGILTTIKWSADIDSDSGNWLYATTVASSFDSSDAYPAHRDVIKPVPFASEN